MVNYATLENNLYYVSSAAPKVHWNDDYIELPQPSGSGIYGAVSISGNDLCTAFSQECDGVVADPGFADLAGKDFRLTQGSPAINTGQVLDDVPDWWDVPTIQGVDYSTQATLNSGLDPDHTDFTTIPPTVVTVDRNTNGTGWEIGAFDYPE